MINSWPLNHRLSGVAFGKTHLIGVLCDRTPCCGVSIYCMLYSFWGPVKCQCFVGFFFPTFGTFSIFFCYSNSECMYECKFGLFCLFIFIFKVANSDQLGQYSLTVADSRPFVTTNTNGVYIPSVPQIFDSYPCTYLWLHKYIQSDHSTDFMCRSKYTKTFPSSLLSTFTIIITRGNNSQ